MSLVKQKAMPLSDDKQQSFPDEQTHYNVVGHDEDNLCATSRYFYIKLMPEFSIVN